MLRVHKKQGWNSTKQTIEMMNYIVAVQVLQITYIESMSLFILQVFYIKFDENTHFQ